MPTRFPALAVLAGAGLLPGGAAASAQALDPGRKTFEQRCALCHGADGDGGETGPPIAVRLSAIGDRDLVKLIHEGRPARGMPPTVVPDAEMTALLGFLRTLQREAPPVVRRAVQTTGGRRLEGQLLGEGFDDLQLLTDDKRVRLLRRAGDRFREVTSEADWPTYNGDPGGNRHTTLAQIDKTTVARLAPRWLLTIPDAGLLQATPVVAGGALPVHPARPVGLGRHPDVGPRRMEGPAARAVAAREPQRLLLRLRSPRRRAAPGQALRPKPDLGLRHRR